MTRICKWPGEVELEMILSALPSLPCLLLTAANTPAFLHVHHGKRGDKGTQGTSSPSLSQEVQMRKQQEECAVIPGTVGLGVDAALMELPACFQIGGEGLWKRGVEGWEAGASFS